MLYDRKFLRELDHQKNKIIYGRITSLTFEELPIETVEGKITSGSVNIDGASAVRRTCSLSMIAENPDMRNYQWTLHTKFKLEVGVKNLINKNYPDIIWFNQGIFVLTTFSCALSTNACTINLQGKDKMCMLNGEVGGSITAPTRFDSWEQEMPNGDWKMEKYPIKDIVRDAVHQYAGEPFHNIIINDLDDLALQLLEYRYDKPLYLLRRYTGETYDMGTLNGQTTFDQGKTLDDAQNIFDPLINTIDGSNTNSTIFEKNGMSYCAAKVQFGQTAGYKQTELIYNDELMGNVGESITSVLDKIKNLLGQFEYFYDLDGRFVFQKKQDYINTIWTPIYGDGDNAYIDPIVNTDSVAYTFTGSELITAFNSTPNLANLRNDYSIWGARKGAGGDEIPIHLRYAIDKKPVSYTTYSGVEYTSEDYDWRELLFQMQADYRKHHREADFLIKVAQNNPQYPTGLTGYESYYIDIEGFWRQLYYPKSAYDEQINKYNIKIKELTDQLENTIKGSDYYKSIETQLQKVQTQKELFITDYNESYFHIENCGSGYYEQPGWAKSITQSPETLNYWIDFLDLDGELDNFSCKAVGIRPKAINDTNIKSIYFRDTPGIIFYKPGEITHKSGYRYFQCPELDTMFSASAQGISAKEHLDELLYEHAYCVESVTVTTIPIYYLQPNTRVRIEDEKRGIKGEYIVSKLTVPLSYNGTMQLTTTRAATEQRVF